MSVNRFAKVELTFPFNGKVRTLKATISETGAYHVEKINKLSMRTRSSKIIAKSVSINLEIFQKPAQAFFVREIDDNSAFYNLQFANMNDSQIRSLKGHIAHYGFPSPWNRKFPRLTAKVRDPRFIVPYFADLEIDGIYFNPSIINFTVDGLLFKIPSDDPAASKIRPGKSIRFDLLMSTGLSIYQFQAEIVRYTECVSMEDFKTHTLFGVKITSQPKNSRRLYYGCIKKYAQILKSDSPFLQLMGSE